MLLNQTLDKLESSQYTGINWHPALAAGDPTLRPRVRSGTSQGSYGSSTRSARMWRRISCMASRLRVG
jgi:hypothetical protein